MFQLAINIKAAKACLLNFKDVVENILKDEPSTTQQSFCQNPTNENFMKWAKASTQTAKEDIKSSPAKKSLSQILQNDATNTKPDATNTRNHKCTSFHAVH